MKHMAFITVSVCIFITVLATVLMPGDGKYAGKIGSIDSGKNEITINVESGQTVKMGEQLYVRAGGVVVIMEATFPMQTIVKCRLVKASSGYLKNLEKGMSVFKYDKSAIVDNDKNIKYKSGRVQKIGNIDIVKLPGGTFIMGLEDGAGDEKPVHKVTVGAFYISVYEVTQKQYKEIIGTNPSSFKGDDLPVENVSWEDAVAFCKKFSEKYKVNSRLPYEAEWEYACRAGATTKYYWGDELNGDYAWYDDNSGSKTHPAGQKKPNAFGLYDMSGNVWEWCMDWYSESYYVNSPSNNPGGPGGGEYRVIRGGSWFNDVKSLRSFCRNYLRPGLRTHALGFRLVIVR